MPHNPITQVCPDCGKTFTFTPTTQYHRRRFCSRSCSNRNKETKPLLERFWAGVEKTPDCWLWTKNRNRGYGMICDVTAPNRYRFVHRLAWEIHFGPIPEDLFVLHRCDVRHCVNPAHLFLGTHRDNVDDMMRKGRQGKGIRNGRSRVTDEQVIEIRRLYSLGKLSQGDLGRMFGVARSTIGMLVRGDTWPHL
jgi:hypothetical protein